MHELPVTESIFQIVLKHAQKGGVKRVVTINLEIGALSDLQSEWIQRYFDHLSRGSVVEGAKLKITRIPAVFHCDSCDQSFEVTSLLEEGSLRCKQCRSQEVTLVSGREYRIRDMEVL